MKYCGYCGKALEDNEKCTCADSTRKKKKTLLFTLIGIAATLPILLIGLVVAIIIGTAKVNPSAYLSKPVFTGNNTMGYASVNFDERGLIESIIGEEPLTYFDEESMRWFEQYEEYAKCITCEYERSGLSNGDEFTVKIITTGIAAEKIKSIEKTFVVSGLKEIETIDVFGEIELSFSGVSGSASATLAVNTDNEIINFCRFKIEPQYNLENGDIVTITITNQESVCDKYSVVPRELIKEYTVSGLREYATADTLPMDIVDELVNLYITEKSEEIEKENSWIWCDEPKLYGCYFMEKKDGAFFCEENEFHILVYYNQYVYEDYHSTIYLPLIFENIMVNTDGSVDINYEDGHGTGFFYTEFESYINKFDDDYNITQIK